MKPYSHILIAVLVLFSAQAGAEWEDPNQDTSVIILPFLESTTNLTEDVSNVGTNDGDIYYGETNAPTWIAATNTTVAHYSFDAANKERIVVEDSDTLEDIGASNQSFSVVVWFKTTNDFSSFGTLIGKNDNGSLFPVWLRMHTSNALQFRHHDGTSGQNVGVANVANDGDWHLGVAVRDRDADTLSLYIDGVINASVTDSLGDTSVSGHVSFGAAGGSNYDGYPFTGEMYRPAIYTNAISSNDIYQMYLNTHPTNRPHATGSVFRF